MLVLFFHSQMFWLQECFKTSLNNLYVQFTCWEVPVGAAWELYSYSIHWIFFPFIASLVQFSHSRLLQLLRISQPSLMASYCSSSLSREFRFPQERVISGSPVFRTVLCWTRLVLTSQAMDNMWAELHLTLGLIGSKLFYIKKRCVVSRLFRENFEHVAI